MKLNPEFSIFTYSKWMKFDEISLKNFKYFTCEMRSLVYAYAILHSFSVVYKMETFCAKRSWLSKNNRKNVAKPMKKNDFVCLSNFPSRDYLPQVNFANVCSQKNAISGRGLELKRDMENPLNRLRLVNNWRVNAYKKNWMEATINNRITEGDSIVVSAFFSNILRLIKDWFWR